MVVAGIPIVHVISPPATLAPYESTFWRPPPATQPPIIVEHRVGSTDVTGFEVIISVPPWQTIYRDPVGEMAALFYSFNPAVPRALLRTRVAGAKYELLYDQEPRVPLMRRGRDQVIYSLALAARGTGTVVHSCGFLLPDGTGVLCPGVSGTGKTTMARMLSESGANVTALSDDRCVLLEGAGAFHLHGTPWPGAGQVIHEGGGPLRAIVLMRRGAAPKWREATPAEMARDLLDTTMLPVWESSQVARLLEFLDRLTTEVPGYFFEYPPEPASAEWMIRQLVHSGRG